MRTAALLAACLAMLVLVACDDARKPPVRAEAPRAASVTPRTTIASNAAEADFQAATLAFRQGDHDMAYGRFVALANDGDRRAAGIALAMLRFGSELFDRPWDASLDEMADWAALAGTPERDADPWRFTASAVPVASQALAMSTFQADRRKR